MHIIGITFIAEDGTPHTLLVRSSVNVMSVTARQILPWFFSNQAIPLLSAVQENSIAVRVRTGADPFRHLRRTKGARFDGKGFTVQRSVRHSEIVHIDGDLKVSIEDFKRLCLGLFYGTANYPNLNLLLSQRRFRLYVADPAMLWTILSDCLLYPQYNAHHQTGDEFKLEMRRKYLATQLKDYRPMIEEIEQRLQETKQYDQLNVTLQQMIAAVHSRQIQKLEDEAKEFQRTLRSIADEKNQLLARRLVHDMDEIEARDREIAFTNLSITIHELESMHGLLEAEKDIFNSNVEDPKAAIEELVGNLSEIEDSFSRLEAIPLREFELQNARCAIENNHSLGWFTKLSEETERQLYIANLETQKQSLMIDIQSAEEDVEQAANEKLKAITALRKLKNRVSASAPDNDPHFDDVLRRLQCNINEIVLASNELAKIEFTIVHLDRKIRQHYSTISSVPFDELLSIAAVKYAVVEQLDGSAREDFLGFVYDRALECGINTKWLEGFSHAAIFKTLESAICVMQLVERLPSGAGFAYIILNARLRTSLNSLLRDKVPEVAISTNYGDTVEKVNQVTERMVDKLRSTQKLKQTRERLAHLADIKAELLAELGRARSGHNAQRPSTNIPDLSKLMERFIKAKNHKTCLQARHESLEHFIRQIDGGVVPLPNEEQLKANEIRLAEELMTSLKNAVKYRKPLYDGLKQLSAAYNKLQFAIARLNDGAWPMADLDLSPPKPSARKLFDCWTTCCESIRRGIAGIEKVQNKLKPKAEEELTSAKVNELNEKMQSLKLRETSLVDRLTSATNRLAEYWQENNLAIEGQSQTPSQIDSLSEEQLLVNILHTRGQLQQLPPAWKSAEVVKMKTKLKHLQLLENIRLNAREMCLNNLILPVIEKLHVQKLRQMCQLVESVSDELPELGGMIKVTFGYAPNERPDAQDKETKFKMDHINTVNIHIINESGNEMQMSEKQLQLAYLILFLCFLYCDSCKLVLLDKSFEKLFDSGIVGMTHVLEKFFPTMQSIVLDNERSTSESV